MTMESNEDFIKRLNAGDCKDGGCMRHEHGTPGQFCGSCPWKNPLAQGLNVYDPSEMSPLDMASYWHKPAFRPQVRYKGLNFPQLSEKNAQDLVNIINSLIANPDLRLKERYYLLQSQHKLPWIHGRLVTLAEWMNGSYIEHIKPYDEDRT